MYVCTWARMNTFLFSFCTHRHEHTHTHQILKAREQLLWASKKERKKGLKANVNEAEPEHGKRERD